MQTTLCKDPLYLKPYGLSTAPFRLSPDPHFFFPSKSHLAAKEVLKYAIARDEGFMVLIGQAGTGKTLTLRMLINELADHKVIALILSPAISPKGLLQLLLDELDVTTDTEQESALLLKEFQTHLIKLAEQGKEILIIVDEAQNMPIPTLEQLRMLSNIETSNRKLLQILLVGQLKLGKVLEDQRLGQLTQRIAVQEYIYPLTANEMREYIRFRLTKAGRADINISKKATKLLFNSSNGIPRLINRLMDRALLIAGSQQAQTIAGRHIKAACQSLPNPAPEDFFRKHQPYLVGLLILVTFCFIFLYWQ